MLVELYEAKERDYFQFDPDCGRDKIDDRRENSGFENGIQIPFVKRTARQNGLTCNIRVRHFDINACPPFRRDFFYVVDHFGRIRAMFQNVAKHDQIIFLVLKFFRETIFLQLPEPFQNWRPQKHSVLFQNDRE